MSIKIEEECVKISRGQLNHINSITGDTCGTNFATFKQLESLSSLTHCFFIPYDAHSL